MNVLLLGNGFDLAHDLPTKYINFMHTVQFLSQMVKYDIDPQTIKTVGDIFGKPQLYENDKTIKISYEKYQKEYEATEVSRCFIMDMVELAQINPWFIYFNKIMSDDVTWIDFEKEISEVIFMFSNILNDRNIEKISTLEGSIRIVKQEIKHSRLSRKEQFLLDTFDYFIFVEKSIIKTVGGRERISCHRVIKPNYLIKHSAIQDMVEVDYSKIIKELSTQLQNFADGLRAYLKSCVENVVLNISSEKKGKWSDVFPRIVDRVITFNYTNTYEKLYGACKVTHIHGNVDSQIVLGVNPDMHDELDRLDTKFLTFKKYYQRVILKSDVDYLTLINASRKSELDIALYVIGHSLDVTDRDVIEELFEVSKEIFVVSHSEENESEHVINLIKIFGKQKFDSIRREKRLTFIHIDDNLRDIMRSRSSYLQMEKRINDAMNNTMNNLKRICDS